MLLWPVERAREVMHAWREWTETAPETVTTSARIMHLPPMPELPDFLRGRSVVVIDGASLGDEATAAAAIAPLRALEPEVDTFAMIPPVGLSYIHMDPEDPMPGLSDSTMLDALPAEAIDAHRRRGRRAGAGADVRDPAPRRRPARAAAPARSAASTGPTSPFAVGMPMSPEIAAAIRERPRPAHGPAGAATRPAVTTSTSPSTVDPASFYGEENYARLRRVKAQVDPDDVFRATTRSRPRSRASHTASPRGRPQGGPFVVKA